MDVAGIATPVALGVRSLSVSRIHHAESGRALCTKSLEQETLIIMTLTPELKAAIDKKDVRTLLSRVRDQDNDAYVAASKSLGWN